MQGGLAKGKRTFYPPTWKREEPINLCFPLSWMVVGAKVILPVYQTIFPTHALATSEFDSPKIRTTVVGGILNMGTHESWHISLKQVQIKEHTGHRVVAANSRGWCN